MWVQGGAWTGRSYYRPARNVSLEKTQRLQKRPDEENDPGHRPARPQRRQEDHVGSESCVTR